MLSLPTTHRHLGQWTLSSASQGFGTPRIRVSSSDGLFGTRPPLPLRRRLRPCSPTHTRRHPSGELLGTSAVPLPPDRIVRGVVPTATGDIVLAIGAGGLSSLDAQFDELRLVQVTGGDEIDRISLDTPGSFLGHVDGVPLVLDFPSGVIRLYTATTSLSPSGQSDLDFTIQSLPLSSD